MPATFRKDISELKRIVGATDVKGAWSEAKNLYQFKSAKGGVMNFWPSNMSVSFQGDPTGSKELESLMKQHLTGVVNEPEHSLDDFFE